MSFSAFFQENIYFFIAAIAILGYLMFLEARGAKTRGTVLTTAQFTQRINQGATLIDLRNHDDFKNGHIAGARHIGKDELSKQLDNLSKTSPVALYCYSGAISGKAVSEMKQAGFAEAFHLGGGIAAWQRDNLPTTKD